MTVLWGSHYITGFSESSEIKVSTNGDAVTPKTGIQGDTVYAINPDHSGKATFNLFATASVLASLRTDARAGTRRSLTIRDPGADSAFLLQADDCVITKVPDFVRGKEGGSVEIGIYIPDYNPLE